MGRIKISGKIFAIVLIFIIPIFTAIILVPFGISDEDKYNVFAGLLYLVLSIIFIIFFIINNNKYESLLVKSFKDDLYIIENYYNQLNKKFIKYQDKLILLKNKYNNNEIAKEIIDKFFKNIETHIFNIDKYISNIKIKFVYMGDFVHYDKYENCKNLEEKKEKIIEAIKEKKKELIDLKYEEERNFIYLVNERINQRRMILNKYIPKYEININELKNKIDENLKSYVKLKSKLYSKLTELNRKYEFNKQEFVKNYNFYLDSKTQFNNFDFNKKLTYLIDENDIYYENVKKWYEDDLKRYSRYLEEYKNLKEYMLKKEKYNLNDKLFLYFNNVEKEIYENLIQNKILEPKVNIHINYTSQTGRNVYDSNKEYEYYELLRFINDYKKEKARKKLKEEEQFKKNQDKKEKEKRLKELDKLEVKLAQKEEEISKKEQEFIEATKEHIYTTDKVEIIKQDIIIDDNLSLTQKMRLLREKFDNGEITYEEYQSKRKELI